MGRIDIYPKKTLDGQEAHENMLYITNYQRNANQNYSEVPPHTGQNGHHQKVYIISCREKGTLLHCWWEVNWYNFYGDSPEN